MSSRVAALKLTLCRAVLIGALPTACAVGVTQEGPGDTSDPIDTAGSSTGGMPGASGSTSALPKAGTTSSAGTPAVNPFGGSASTAGSGSGGQSSAGAAGSGGKAGSSSSGGAGGTAGSSAGGRGGGTSGGGSASGGSSGAGTSGAGGTGSSGCACMTPKTWTDDTNLTFGPGDCLDVDGAIYLYTGTKAQTWAQAACNPTKPAAWCSDVGADYKFMLCK